MENILIKNEFRIFLAVVFFLPLSACSSSEVYSSEPLPESTIYMVEEIDNPRLQFLWLELPDPIIPGAADVRLFFAKTEPPEPTIPNPNDLRCALESENDFVILGPERVPFEFNEDGTFSGSYTYRACPECVECYMNWDYTLEITGTVLQETTVLEIAVVHFGLNVQGSYISVELEAIHNANLEPRISCNKMIKIKFEDISI